MSSSISVVINTFNAEKWLDYALRSVESWAGEIVVVDMHSEDRTQEIARAHGARLLLHERIGYVEPARAFAVALATHEWVLILDADEMVPEPLSRRLCEISTQGVVDAVSLPRLNYILGAPVMHTGWGPDQDRHWRFFRRGSIELPERIHGAMLPRAGTRTLRLPATEDLALVHFNYVDVEDFMSRLNRYTSIEAAGARRRGAAQGAVPASAREFLTRWIRHGGWRDGWRGFYLTLMMMSYRVVAAAKSRELRAGNSRPVVEQRYRDLAERVAMGYAAPKK
jgi:glycosyltransferase involved in cell wall biosynthesis